MYPVVPIFLVEADCLGSPCSFGCPDCPSCPCCPGCLGRHYRPGYHAVPFCPRSPSCAGRPGRLSCLRCFGFTVPPDYADCTGCPDRQGSPGIISIDPAIPVVSFDSIVVVAKLSLLSQLSLLCLLLSTLSLLSLLSLLFLLSI